MNPLAALAVLGAIGMIVKAVLSGTHSVPAPAPSAEPKPAATPELKKAITDNESKLPSSMPSPIPGVTDAAWAKYVGMWKQADADAVTTDGRRGVFLIGLPTLVDQGYMKRIGKGTGKAYKAEWKAPYSQSVFAKNLKLQYDILAEQARRHYKMIQAQWGNMLNPPTTIVIETQDGGQEHVPLSLSGMMAVSRQAAIGGLAKWLKDPASRKGNTTEIFSKFNGIF